MHIHLRAVLAFVVALSCLGSGPAAPQTSSTRGGISGRVLDIEHSPVSGATVTATNSTTGLRRITTSDSGGNFEIGLLPPGLYRVDALSGDLAGWRGLTVTVSIAAVTHVALLPSAEVAEEITVTPAPLLVDLTSGDLAVSVSEREIDTLPLLGRDFKDLVFLTPGTAAAIGDRVSLNGARGVNTDFNIDGAEANSDFFGEERGGTKAPFVISQAAVREFQVVRSTYEAEYPRGVGATVNAITKSGGNTFEGELFFFRRKAAWSSERPALGAVTPSQFAEARNSDQYGATFGGPIWRDHFHFFVAADLQQISEAIVTRDVRTTPEFQSLAPIIQDSFAQRVEQLLGTTLDEQFRFQSTEDQETYLIKLDAHVGMYSHASLRYSRSDFNSFPSEGAADILSNNGNEFNIVDSTVLELDSILRPTLVNQAIAQYAMENRPVSPVNRTLPETVIQGLQNFTFGQSEFLPGRTREAKWQLKDSLTKLAARHQIKLGASYSSAEVDNLFPRELAGQFFFRTAQDFLANRPSRLDQGYGPTLGLNAFRYKAQGAFLQDTVPVLDTVTLHYGLRYDAQTVPSPVANAYPDHPEFVANFGGKMGSWAPRLSLAWASSRDGRSVFRWGIGKYYNPLPMILYAGPLAEVAGLFNRITVDCSHAPCPTYPSILTPEEFSRAARTSSNVTIVSPDFDAPESLRSSFAFERRLNASASLALEAVYARIDHAPRLVQVNAVPTGFTYGNLPVYELQSTARPYPDLQTVRMHISDTQGTYRAVTVSTRGIAGRPMGLTWRAHYTLSEAIDQDSNERGTSTSLSLDPSNPRLSEGRADYDVTHRLVVSLTRELPWGLLLSAIFNWRSGTPYTAGIDVLGTAGLNGLDFQGVETPVFRDQSGQVIDLTLASGLTPLELSRFLAERGATIDQRNRHNQPAFRNLDLRITKAIAWHGSRIELIGEIFNALNERNPFINPSNQVMYTGELRGNLWSFRSNPAFGNPNSYDPSSRPRQYQAAIRLSF